MPPLEGLRDILSSTTPGAFELNEGTNYITMGYHVKLLAAAINDVEGYIELERENAVTKSPSTEKISQLSRITAAIDLLHDQIGTFHLRLLSILFSYRIISRYSCRPSRSIAYQGSNESCW